MLANKNTAAKYDKILTPPTCIMIDVLLRSVENVAPASLFYVMRSIRSIVSCKIVAVSQQGFERTLRRHVDIRQPWRNDNRAVEFEVIE